jgi:hypothetical protein
MKIYAYTSMLGILTKSNPEPAVAFVALYLESRLFSTFVITSTPDILSALDPGQRVSAWPTLLKIFHLT